MPSKAMTSDLHLQPRHRRVIEGLARQHLPDVDIWAYGSRVSGQSHDGSDLDLVLRGPELAEVPSLQLAGFWEALQESTLPFLVEARDWARLPERFHGEIQRNYVPLVSAQGRWRDVTLGDCIEMNDAVYTLREQWPFINYLDTGNLTRGRIDAIQHLVVGKDKVPSRARRKVQLGDVLYSTVRPNQRHFGIIKSVPENFLASTGFAVIRGKEKCAHTDFIYWFLAQDSVVEQLHTIAEHSASAYPSIRPVDIERLRMKLPTLPEQRAIARILSALDDRIELNRCMVETVEKVIGSVFGFLFRGQCSTSCNLANLGDLIDFNPVYHLDQGDSAPYLDMANMPTKAHTPHAVTYRPYRSGSRFQNGDTLVARITPCLENGKAAYVDFLKDGEVGWGSTEFIVMRPRHPIPHEFTYCLARDESFRHFAVVNMTGTSGRQRVSAESLAAFPVALPNPTACHQFGQCAKPLFARARAAALESRSLASLRDALLPKLLSGAIRVPDAEKTVEAAI